MRGCGRTHPLPRPAAAPLHHLSPFHLHPHWHTGTLGRRAPHAAPPQGLGAVNFYMCQFPFDLARPSPPAHLEALSTYDYVLLNSGFTDRWGVGLGGTGSGGEGVGGVHRMGHCRWAGSAVTSLCPDAAGGRCCRWYRTFAAPALEASLARYSAAPSIVVLHPPVEVGELLEGARGAGAGLGSRKPRADWPICHATALSCRCLGLIF